MSGVLAADGLNSAFRGDDVHDFSSGGRLVVLSSEHLLLCWGSPMSGMTSKTAIWVGIAIGGVGMLALTEATRGSWGLVLDSTSTRTPALVRDVVQLPHLAVAPVQQAYPCATSSPASTSVETVVEAVPTEDPYAG